MYVQVSATPPKARGKRRAWIAVAVEGRSLWTVQASLRPCLRHTRHSRWPHPLRLHRLLHTRGSHPLRLHPLALRLHPLALRLHPLALRLHPLAWRRVP